MKPKTDYLVETSAVPVALGESTPNHCRDFTDATADGRYCTSIYIRKEFIRRWVCTYIELACEVDHFESVDHAMYHLEQDFSIRNIKANFHAVATMLRQKGAVQNTRDMAKEFARLAIGKLHEFDRLFRTRTRNSCGCQIGGKELRVDFNTLFDDLRVFIKAVGSVDDCPVNEFLDLGKFGKASRLLEEDGVADTKPGVNLAGLHEEGQWITFKECATIGDCVIALDQPRSCCLVHIDEAFDVLCPAAERQHKRIPSQRASEKSAGDTG
jgi:hypothetical protein